MATSGNSVETNWSPWISSAADSPARISAWPESRKESRALAASFGLSSPVWFGDWDLDGCSLRTCQVSLFTEQCDELSANWPDSGMWDAGAVYELASSEPPISANACSLWPTAMANDAEKRGDFDPERSPCLAAAAKTWPTVRGTEGTKGGPNQAGSRGDLMLSSATANWATPNAHDGSRPGSDATSRQGANLKRDAEIWQTPATDSFRQRSGNRSNEMGLDQQARFFPTLSARDWKSGDASEATMQRNARPLNEIAERFQPSLPAPPTPDGPPSSSTIRGSHRR